MSMYNMVMGVNPFAPMLLKFALKLTPGDVPRLRDVWWNGEHVVMLTRTGGGNREFYEDITLNPGNPTLRRLPGYVRDEDDDYDATYALFYYELPKELEWIRSKLVPMVLTSKERWEAAIEKIKNPVDRTDSESIRVHEAAASLTKTLIGLL